MSRALDSSAAASILATNPQAAYNDIVEALNSNTTDLLNIEFLGKGYPLPHDCNVLHDGVSIGVPKLKLVQAFIVARQLFFKCLKDFKRDKFQDIRNATAVILLMDPEHVTAANSRKKMIQQLRTDSEAELHGVLSRELLVIDSFLTSWLHRHTKSPTLWGHRRWLLQVLCSLNFPHDIERDLQKVVLVAAERHPRNYYAWLHLRWLVQNLQEQDDGNPGDPPVLDQSKILSVVKDWCLRHPSDTSGWSFLLFQLFSIELPKSVWAETYSSICREVLGIASSFQWTHESVWVFLRTLVASGKIQEEQRSSFFKTVEAAVAASHTDTKARKVLKTSFDWCLDYSV
jgi:protein prenyltransferase alpha subunit repeat containing protein 1